MQAVRGFEACWNATKWSRALPWGEEIIVSDAASAITFCFHSSCSGIIAQKSLRADGGMESWRAHRVYEVLRMGTVGNKGPRALVNGYIAASAVSTKHVSEQRGYLYFYSM